VQGRGHDGQCGKTFKWDERGRDDDNWQAHHMHGQAAAGSDGTMNCKTLSVPCHRNTQNFGRRATKLRSSDHASFHSETALPHFTSGRRSTANATRS